MQDTPPFAPADFLQLSRAFRFKMAIVFICAQVFGFWDRPDKRAATAFEEMTLWDKYYWAYKNRHPITRVERGEQLSDLIQTDKGVVGLPPGFEKQASLTVGAGGDLFYSQALEHSKDRIFEGITDLLFDQTIAYANLESPLTEQASNDETVSDKDTPVECCSREQFNILKGHKGKRFNVLNTANNHMFDMGAQGVERTQKVLSDEGILDVGTNSTPGEFGQGKILVKDGIKLGFVAATFGLNGRNMPAGEEYRIHVAKLSPKCADPELDLLKRQIDHCKSQGCDFIIASLHWGYEFEFFPRKKQVAACHALVEWGADAILCHHSHVVQPVEYYRTRRDPNRIAVIADSLGSLVWSFSAPYLVLSAILNLTLSKGRVQGKEVTYVEKARVTPVFRSYSDHGDQRVMRIEKLSDHIRGRSAGPRRNYIAEIKHYADLVLGDYESTDERVQDSATTKTTKIAA